MKTRQIKVSFFSDPGHGWLQVPHSLILELGIQNKVSNSSYVTECYAYLEEDLDAGIFLQAAKAAGWQVKATPRPQSESYSKIRDHHHFSLSLYAPMVAA